MRQLVGVFVFIKGLKSCFRHRDLLWAGLGISSVLLIGCLVGLFYGASALTEFIFSETNFDTLWQQLLYAITWLTIGLSGLTILPVLLSVLVSLLLPMLRGPLFERVLQEAQTRLQTRPVDRVPLSTAVSIKIDLYRLAFAVIGTAIIGLVGFILGPPLWGIAQILFGAWCLGVDTVGLAHESQGLIRSKQDRFNRAHKALTLGIGLITMVLYAIPVLQLLAPMAVTTGAAELSAWLSTQPATET